MKGAGGKSGGVGTFFLGLAMMCGGGYLLLQSITVTHSFGMGMSLYRMPWIGGGDFSITSGMVLVPFIFGIGMVFYNSRNILGWILFCGSLITLVFGVLATVRFVMRGMSAFDLIVILILAVGGLGLFLRSLRELPSESA